MQCGQVGPNFEVTYGLRTTAKLMRAYQAMLFGLNRDNPVPTVYPSSFRKSTQEDEQ
jgi:hypothetical protein